MPDLTTTVTGYCDFRSPEGITISGPAQAHDYKYTIKVAAASETDARKALLDLLTAVEDALGFAKAQPWVDLKKGNQITVRFRDIEQLFEVVTVSTDGTFNLKRIEES